jgi:hypothetical protein
VANYNDDTIGVLLGHGDGTFSNYTTYSSVIHPYSILSADLNNDGKVDLAVTNSDGANTISVLLGNGNGKFQNEIIYAVGDVPIALAVGVFRNKQKLDLAVTNGGENNVAVLLNSCP